jgi:ketosteroid isomerase-like protein
VSQENVEIVRGVMEAWAHDAPESALAYLHPNVEFDARVRPDGKVWHGRDGVRQALIEWTGTWSDWRQDVERYIDAGDDRVVLLWRETGRAMGSGVPVSQQGATVVTIREGMIVSAVISLNRDQTLAALGLEG